MNEGTPKWFDESHDHEPDTLDFGPLWDGDTTPPVEPAVDIPELVRDAYREEDKTLLWTTAGIATALLAGYVVKRKLKNRG